MAKFRKKPIVVDAWQWPGGHAEAATLVLDIIEGGGGAEYDGARIKITTLEGVMACERGDWIIKGVNGEYYPCKPDIFAKTYEAA